MYVSLSLLIGKADIVLRAKSTGRNKLTAKKWFRHNDFVTDFVTVAASQSEGLGKMALEII